MATLSGVTEFTRLCIQLGQPLSQDQFTVLEHVFDNSSETAIIDKPQNIMRIADVQHQTKELKNDRSNS